jgi:hypothetical protein
MVIALIFPFLTLYCMYYNSDNAIYQPIENSIKILIIAVDFTEYTNFMHPKYIQIIVLIFITFLQ